MEGVVYAAYCHTQDIACSFNHGCQQRAQLQYNCKAFEPVIVGMVLNSKQ